MVIDDADLWNLKKKRMELVYHRQILFLFFNTIQYSEGYFAFNKNIEIKLHFAIDDFLLLTADWRSVWIMQQMTKVM